MTVTGIHCGTVGAMEHGELVNVSVDAAVVALPSTAIVPERSGKVTVRSAPKLPVVF